MRRSKRMIVRPSTILYSCYYAYIHNVYSIKEEFLFRREEEKREKR
jgi:hypothetical protein